VSGLVPTRGTVTLDGQLCVTLDCGCRVPWTGEPSEVPDWLEHEHRSTAELLDLDNPGEAEREYARSLCDWQIAFVPEAGAVNGEPVGDDQRGAVAGEIGGAS
jgi:hypothetical protein